MAVNAVKLLASLHSYPDYCAVGCPHPLGHETAVLRGHGDVGVPHQIQLYPERRTVVSLLSIGTSCPGLSTFSHQLRLLHALKVDIRYIQENASLQPSASAVSAVAALRNCDRRVPEYAPHEFVRFPSRCRWNDDVKCSVAC
jgi:hypothetical protein